MDKKLSDFIKKVGDEKAANIFGVKKRTAQAYRLGTRKPSAKRALVIVRKTKRLKHGPVTMNGIYGL